MDSNSASKTHGENEIPADLKPIKYLLLVPALAGLGLYELLTSIRTTGMPKMSADNFGLWLILLVHIVWVLAPVVAYRKATGKFLGFAFKTGMVLWLVAYSIGFALPFCYPLIVPYL